MTDCYFYRCHSTEPEELVQLQDVKWGPAVEWFKARYSVDVSHSNGFIMPDVDRQTKLKMNNYLLTHDAWCLIGKAKYANIIHIIDYINWYAFISRFGVNGWTTQVCNFIISSSELSFNC